jgi:peroxiredoxin
MKYFSYIVLLFSVLLIHVSCEVISDKQPSYEDTSIVKVGDKAPDFEVISLDNQPLMLPNGTPTLLILFSHTCPDCQNMMGDLQEWLNKNEGEHNIIAISRGGTTEDITAFRDEYSLTFSIAADENAEIYYKYATMYVPRCYVINGEGIIEYITYEYLSGDVDALMTKLNEIK